MGHAVVQRVEWYDCEEHLFAQYHQIHDSGHGALESQNFYEVQYLQVHLHVPTVSGRVVGHLNQCNTLCELRVYFECFDGLGEWSDILG